MGHPRVREAAARAWRLTLEGATRQITAAVAAEGTGRGEGRDRMVTERTVLLAYVVLASAVGAGEGPGPDPSVNWQPPSDSELSQIGLKAWVESRLPSAAVPAAIMALPSLPRNPAGKVIRSQLPRPTWMMEEAKQWPDSTPSATRQTTSEHRSHQSTRMKPSVAISESVVMAAFIRALGRRDLEPTDDFFAAGWMGDRNICQPRLGSA